MRLKDCTCDSEDMKKLSGSTISKPSAPYLGESEKGIFSFSMVSDVKPTCLVQLYTTYTWPPGAWLPG